MKKNSWPKDTCIIIPAYNEEKHIGNLIDQLLKRKIPKHCILAIDDGSTDNTWAIISKKLEWVIRHSKNKGKGASHFTGFREAYRRKFHYVITMDADGAHSPNYLDSFLKERGNDIVVGVREINLKTLPFARVISNRLSSLIVSLLSGKKIKDSQSGYRMLNLKSIIKIPLSTYRYDTESELLIKGIRMRLSYKEIKIKSEHKKNCSHINPFLDTLRFLKLVFKSLWR